MKKLSGLCLVESVGEHRDVVAECEQMIDEQAQKLKELVRSSAQKVKQGPAAFAELEREAHEHAMQLERKAVEAMLSEGDIDAPAVLIDGKIHRRVLRSSQTYITAAGEVQVQRTLYKDRSRPGSQAVSALDLQVGIVEGYWTPRAASQAWWLVSQMTPGKAEKLLGRIANMTPSKSSLDRLPKQLSSRWEQHREAFEQSLQAQHVVPEQARVLAVSLDGVMAPMQEADKEQTRSETRAKGKRMGGPAGYQEVACGSLALYDEDGNVLQAVRLARSPEKGKKTLKASLVAELARITAQRADLRVVKVADGAKDNWRFLGKQILDGTEILDFYHAAEHLKEALNSAYVATKPESLTRFATLRSVLREHPEGVERVIRALAYLHKKYPRRKTITRELNYFRNNRHRMRYQSYAEQGLPIGSGIIEATCKTLVSERLKLSGMRWSHQGAQAVLTPRALEQSQRFDQAWALLAATFHAQVTTLHNLQLLA
jgi:hypothetical protein